MTPLQQVQIQQEVERIADIPYQSFHLGISPVSFWAYTFNEQVMEDWSEGMEIEVFK